MRKFIERLKPSGHKRWVYYLPVLHLLACIVSMIGLVMPRLQYLGIAWSFIMLADLPISILAYVLAFHSTTLAAVWILIGGTLWWYALSCAVEHFRGRSSDPQAGGPLLPSSN